MSSTAKPETLNADSMARSGRCQNRMCIPWPSRVCWPLLPAVPLPYQRSCSTVTCHGSSPAASAPAEPAPHPRARRSARSAARRPRPGTRSRRPATPLSVRNATLRVRSARKAPESKQSLPQATAQDRVTSPAHHPARPLARPGHDYAASPSHPQRPRPPARQTRTAHAPRRGAICRSAHLRRYVRRCFPSTPSASRVQIRSFWAPVSASACRAPRNLSPGWRAVLSRELTGPVAGLAGRTSHRR